jgi:hypothetical protein
METIFRDERFEDAEIRWSGGATFNIWTRGSCPSGYHSEHGWANTDCFTHYGKAEPGGPCTPAEAAQAARDHFDEWEQEQHKDEQAYEEATT